MSEGDKPNRATDAQLANRRIARPRARSARPARSASSSTTPDILTPPSSKATPIFDWPPRDEATPAPINPANAKQTSQKDSHGVDRKARFEWTPNQTLGITFPEPFREFHGQTQTKALSDRLIGLRPRSTDSVVTPKNSELPQPLHTLYSDEKIPINGSYRHQEPAELPGDAPFPAPNADARRSLPILTVSRSEELLPSPGQHSRRVSDISTVSEVLETHIPYDIESETYPSAVFFTSDYQATLRRGREITEKTVQAIESLGSHSLQQHDLNRLHNDAKAARTFGSKSSKTIAVLGDSGAGKSSLINSLLHFPDVAKTEASGEACTSVVTEYRYKTHAQTSSIAIEVEYLSQSEIAELLKDLLWKFRQVLLPGVKEYSNEEFKKCEEESDQAWSALTAAFQHQPAFKKATLQDMSEGAFDRISHQLIQWATDLNWPTEGSSGKWQTTADTAEECNEKTSVFMTNRFWPFTKVIRIYLDARILKTGVVLADLPGLQDTNSARVKTTQLYLMRCDHVFIVADISRAITNQSVQSSLFDILARHVPYEWEKDGGKNFNVAVVCTKSEFRGLGGARRDFCGKDKRVSPDLMEQLDKAISDAKKNGRDDIRKMNKYRQHEILMKARNDHIKEGLQNAYASKAQNAELNVFCVSNFNYEKFCKRNNVAMVNASGIPELRRFCFAMTAEMQLQETNHYLMSTLSSLLNSIEIWADKSTTDAAGIDDDTQGFIRSMLQRAKDEVFDKINEDKQTFFEDARKRFLDYRVNRNERWERDAKKEHSHWRNWHWASYNAFCLEDGNHTTPAVGHVDWNSHIIWSMRTELEEPWDTLTEDIQNIVKELLKYSNKRLKDLKAVLLEHQISRSTSAGIDFRCQDLEYKFTLVQQDFLKEVQLIRRCASETNLNSYILHEMRPAYHAACLEKGSGKNLRQIGHVEGRITSGTLFWNISDKIAEGLRAATWKGFSALHDAADGVFVDVINDVNMALDSAQQSERRVSSEDMEKRKKMAKEVKNLKKEHEELLKRLVEITGSS